MPRSKAVDSDRIFSKGGEGDRNMENVMSDIRKNQEQIIYKAVKAESNANVAHEIVFGDGMPGKAESNPEWVKSTMRRLERHFESETIKRIRRNCQCGYGMDEKLKLVKEMMSDATNIDEFASSKRAMAAGLFCRNGDLFLQFSVCSCPMLIGIDKLEKNTWCQCTIGYSKVLFEQAFSCSVDVELLKSIKMGDDVCLMKIILYDPVWS